MVSRPTYPERTEDGGESQVKGRGVSQFSFEK